MGALVRMLSYSPAPHMRFAEEAAAEANVRERILTGVGVRFVGGYAILYDVGSPWYSSRRYLIEDMILKVYPDDRTARVADAIAALETLRVEHGCDAIAAGDTQVGKMAPLYHDAGFQTIGVQLFKEPTDGIRSQDHGDASAD